MRLRNRVKRTSVKVVVVVVVVVTAAAAAVVVVVVVEAALAVAWKENSNRSGI